MPNTKSAKKRQRQSEERRLRNKSTKTNLRTRIRKIREAVAAGKLDVAETEFVAITRRLDRAGARYVIHPNKASRLKSRLSNLIRKAKQPATTA
ncbi:MAG: 30S ribosomal protein S20 [Pirellulaceae bacterium]